MGIVNVTDDSFSGDGLLNPEAAVAHGRYLAANGADILDVGGESTRPGATPLPAAEERRRVLPVIAELRRHVTIPISVDTYRAEVADAALEAGADVVNDVWGFRRDPDLAGVVARHGAIAVAMHNRTAPAVQEQTVGGLFRSVEYDDVVAQVHAGLLHSIETLTANNVPLDRIIVDPGIGFGKTPSQNLELLARLAELLSLERPILVGTSRKSVIGVTLGLPPDQRVEGTAATVALAIRQGADVVRVHDLPTMARVARMTDAVVRTSLDAAG
jgi:dihydropteroate synthase